MRAVIASGSGRYADPWHPFPETSRALGSVLSEAGFAVTIDEDVDHAMENLDGVDLLVVNAGDPWRSSVVEAPSLEAVSGFETALQRGIGVLALHCAVSSLRDYPEWAAAIGGIWIPGISFHPPLGQTHVTGARMPDGAAVADFDVFDERYCRLQRVGHSDIIATHEGDGSDEPCVWVREYGSSRIAVDVLGHDADSYASDGHRRLLAQLARWVTQ